MTKDSSCSRAVAGKQTSEMIPHFLLHSKTRWCHPVVLWVEAEPRCRECITPLCFLVRTTRFHHFRRFSYVRV
eukprot:jgi/Bigna1/64251/fgenesh1_kg.71_\